MTYRPRVVDSELQDRLTYSGAVVVQGAKACGKTRTTTEIAGSVVHLDTDTQAQQAAKMTPHRLLEGASPRLIDEWQKVPIIWDHVRREVDRRGGAGHFILTGSLLPAEDAIAHSGAGRISRMTMRPMSLYETGHSDGTASLSEMLAGSAFGGSRSPLVVPAVTSALAIGGWPLHLERSERMALAANRDYVEEIARTDLFEIEGIRRAPRKARRFLHGLARRVSNDLNISGLSRDMGGGVGSIDPETAGKYNAALERLFVVEHLPAWAPHLRSRTPVRETPKIHFVDPSLAVAALGATTERLLDDLEFLGLLFESMVLRDLRVYTQACEADTSHYRDADGLEVDIIVQSRDGRWGAFEVKLGGEDNIEAGARSLIRFRDRVDLDRTGPPAFLGVIAAVEYGYTREDGVLVIPIGNLGP